MLNLSHSMRMSINVHQRMHAMLQAYAEFLANPSLEVQLAQELLRKCRCYSPPWMREMVAKFHRDLHPLPSGAYVRQLHFDEKLLCILMQKMTWEYWPGIGLMTIKTGPANIQGESMPSFSELLPFRAANKFTNTMFLTEVLQLNMHYFFLGKAKGSGVGAVALHTMFASWLRNGRGIPTVHMVMSWAAWVIFCEADSSDGDYD